MILFPSVSTRKRFISHSVQIKHKTDQWHKDMGYVFISHSVQIKRRPRTRTTASCTSFISHSVQIKPKQTLKMSLPTPDFISHSVQIKLIPFYVFRANGKHLYIPLRSDKTYRPQTNLYILYHPLYPTPFR